MVFSRLIELICSFEAFSSREGHSVDDFKEKTAVCVKVSVQSKLKRYKVYAISYTGWMQGVVQGYLSYCCTTWECKTTSSVHIGHCQLCLPIQSEDDKLSAYTNVLSHVNNFLELYLGKFKEIFNRWRVHHLPTPNNGYWYSFQVTSINYAEVFYYALDDMVGKIILACMWMRNSLVVHCVYGYVCLQYIKTTTNSQSPSSSKKVFIIYTTCWLLFTRYLRRWMIWSGMRQRLALILPIASLRAYDNFVNLSPRWLKIMGMVWNCVIFFWFAMISIQQW